MPHAIVGKRRDLAVVALERVEIRVGCPEQNISRALLRRGNVVHQRFPGRRQKWDGSLIDVAIPELLDLQDFPAIDFQAHRHQRIPSSDLQARLLGDLARHRIGDVDLEAGRFYLRPPQHSLADVHVPGVFRHPDVQRQRRHSLGIMLEDGVHVAVHEPNQAGAIAGLHDRRIPFGFGTLLRPGVRDACVDNRQSKREQRKPKKTTAFHAIPLHGLQSLLLFCRSRKGRFLRYWFLVAPPGAEAMQESRA